MLRWWTGGEVPQDAGCNHRCVWSRACTLTGCLAQPLSVALPGWPTLLGDSWSTYRCEQHGCMTAHQSPHISFLFQTRWKRAWHSFVHLWHTVLCAVQGTPCSLPGAQFSTQFAQRSVCPLGMFALSAWLPGGPFNGPCLSSCKPAGGPNVEPHSLCAALPSSMYWLCVVLGSRCLLSCRSQACAGGWNVHRHQQPGNGRGTARGRTGQSIKPHRRS